MFRARSQSIDCLALNDEARSISPSHLLSRRIPAATRRSLFLALLLALPGGAQYNSVQTSRQQVAVQHPSGLSGMGDTDPIEEEKRLKALNAERQKSLVSDTNKLLKLATELNDDVIRTNPTSLDQAQLTKIAEIEKLAHRVKDKMSTSVRGTTDLQPFLFSPVR